MLDHDRLQRRFGTWPLMRIVEATGSLPERYRIEFRIKGLEISGANAIRERDHHAVEINLSLNYPRRMPQCKILTPIFHPNFDQTTICIGDFWAASEGLDDLVVRIARMIAYQEYNIKSPLNGLAAKWAAQHQALLPVDSREMAPPALDEVETGPGEQVQLSDVGGIAPSEAAVETIAPASAEVPVFSEGSVPIESGPVESASAAGAVLAGGQTRPVEDWVNLAPDLSLVSLRVRCERCRCVFELELCALRNPVACPQCRHRHEGGRMYKCLAIESAGLFWFQDADS